MHMLRRTMGMAMPMKLAMEKKVKLVTSFILKSWGWVGWWWRRRF